MNKIDNARKEIKKQWEELFKLEDINLYENRSEKYYAKTIDKDMVLEKELEATPLAIRVAKSMFKINTNNMERKNRILVEEPQIISTRLELMKIAANLSISNGEELESVYTKMEELVFDADAWIDKDETTKD